MPVSLDASGWTLDSTACRTRLVWANERVVEPEMLARYSGAETNIICWYLDRGSVRVENPRGEVTVRRGQWVFPQADKVYQEFSPRSRIISLRFSMSLRGGKPLFSRERTLVFPGVRYPELLLAARELVRQVETWRTGGSLPLARDRIPLEANFGIDAAFQHWLKVYVSVMRREGEVCAAVETLDPRLDRALRWIEDFPLQEKFSESDLARECRISVNQLLRLFKRETGRTPFAHYDHNRLETARHALADTDVPVKELAFDLGFGSLPHFSNWFKQREGLSPRAYRNANARVSV